MLNLTSKPLSLALTLTVNRAIKKILKQLQLAGNMGCHDLDQEKGHQTCSREASLGHESSLKTCISVTEGKQEMEMKMEIETLAW